MVIPGIFGILRPFPEFIAGGNARYTTCWTCHNPGLGTAEDRFFLEGEGVGRAKKGLLQVV